MYTVIAYDICCHKKRTRIFQILKELGINSQRSVFECELTAEESQALLLRLQKIIDPEKDSLLVYPLCRRCAADVHILGQGIPIIHTDWEII